MRTHRITSFLFMAGMIAFMALALSPDAFG